jgi:hypothetical protein
VGGGAPPLPGELGVRVTFLSARPLTPASTPDCEFAVRLRAMAPAAVS